MPLFDETELRGPMADVLLIDLVAADLQHGGDVAKVLVGAAFMVIPQRGSPYTPLAREPTSRYVIPCRSRISTTWRSSSFCSTAHPPRDLLHHRSSVPIGVARAKVAFQPQPHGPIGCEDHSQPLGRSLPAQDLDHGRIEKLDAPLIFQGKTLRGGCHDGHSCSVIVCFRRRPAPFKVEVALQHYSNRRVSNIARAAPPRALHPASGQGSPSPRIMPWRAGRRSRPAATRCSSSASRRRLRGPWTRSSGCLRSSKPE